MISASFSIPSCRFIVSSQLNNRGLIHLFPFQVMCFYLFKSFFRDLLSSSISDFYLKNTIGFSGGNKLLLLSVPPFPRRRSKVRAKHDSSRLVQRVISRTRYECAFSIDAVARLKSDSAYLVNGISVHKQQPPYPNSKFCVSR